MKKLTLHIGIHRTGTTGLQRNLAANRQALVDMGISYPFEGTNHQDIAWALHRGNMTGEQVVERLEPVDAPHIILSGEDFCIHIDLGWLKAIRKHYQLKVVVYLRRQDHWVNSWYNQHVKWPFSRAHSVMTPDQFLGRLADFYWIDFDRTLTLWANAAGRENLVVRVMESGQVKDTIGDFLAIAGIDAGKLALDTSSQNDALPVETLDFARQAGLIDARPGRRMAVINFLKEVVASRSHTGKTVYDRHQRQWILAQFAKTNRKVAQTFFQRDELFLEGPPDDRDFYRPGSLAASLSVEEILVKTVAYLAKDQK